MMLAQPAPLPERLIGGDPDFFLDHTLHSWAGDGFVFDAHAVADYRACFRDPATIHASCEDYRAGWHGDRAIDEDDRDHRIAMPMLVLWGEQGSIAQAEPLATWREWGDDVQGVALPCGHFVAEEAPDAVASGFLEFFGG